jgi:hypothetical protein
MHDSFLVHMFECACNLFHEAPDGRLIELQILTLFFFDQFFEIAFLCPLGDNNKLIVMDKRIDVLNNRWMIQFFHDIDFSKTLLSLPLISHIKNLKHTKFTFIFLSAKGTPC